MLNFSFKFFTLKYFPETSAVHLQHKHELYAIFPKLFLDVFNIYLMLNDSNTCYWFEGLRVFIPLTFLTV